MSRLHLLNRTASTVLYALEFLISLLILGIFSYFLAVLARRDNATIPKWEQAVEGLSGAAALYTLLAVIMTCFLGGITFFAFLAVLLDILFCGAMIAVAIMTRAGRRSCSSRSDNSPIGIGHRTSCRLETVVFAVSIIGAFLFAISAISQVALSRSHKREKRYGPSPANNYTSGSAKRRPWQRKKKATGDAELGVGAGAIKDHQDHASDYTGTTAPVSEPTYGGPVPKYGEKHTVPTPGHQDHTSDYTGTSAPVSEPTYGGPAHKYGQQHPVPAQTSGYMPSYTTQPTGVAPSSTGVSEMDTSHTGTMMSDYGHQNPNPYSEVHGTGYAR